MNEEENSLSKKPSAPCSVLSSSLVSTTPGQLPKKIPPPILKYFVESGRKVDENKPPSNFSPPVLNQATKTPISQNGVETSDVDLTASSEPSSEPPAKKVKRSSTQCSDAKVEKLVYVCPECQFWASKLSAFRQHMLLHSSTQTYRCTGCKLSGNFKCNIINHIERMKEQGDSEHIKGAVCEESTSNPEESYASCLQTQWVLKQSSSGRIGVDGSIDVDSSMDDTPASSSMLMDKLQMSEESDMEDINSSAAEVTDKSSTDKKSQPKRQMKCVAEEKVENRFQLVSTKEQNEDREEMDKRKLIATLEKEIHDGISKLQDIKSQSQQGRKRVGEKKAELVRLESELQRLQTELVSLEVEKKTLAVKTNDLFKRKTQAALALRTLQRDSLEIGLVQVNGQQLTAEQERVLVEGEKSIQRVETELEAIEEEMKKLGDCQVAQRVKSAEEKQSLTTQLIECTRMELTELEANKVQPRMNELREVLEGKIQLHADAEIELAQIIYVKSKLQVRKKVEELSCSVERFRNAPNNNTDDSLPTE